MSPILDQRNRGDQREQPTGILMVHTDLGFKPFPQQCGGLFVDSPATNVDGFNPVRRQRRFRVSIVVANKSALFQRLVERGKRYIVAKNMPA